MKENIKSKSPDKGSTPKAETKKKEEASFFQPKVIQPSLKVGRPDDPFEQEADRVSAQFVQNHDMISGMQSKLPISGAMAQTLLQPKLSGLRINRKIHRRLQLSLAGLLQTKCDDCEEEVQKSTSVYRSGAGGFVSPNIEQQINNSKGKGSAMDSNTKAVMEAGLGADFSSVRIHTDSKAVQMSRDLNAHAFTVGSDVFFNQSKYQPGTREGKGLLAHELTHVVQQGQAVQKKSKTNSLLSNPAISNKVQGGDFSRNSGLYRKEIATFQKSNPSSEIMMKQQELLQTKEAGTSITKDHSNTLRRCPDDGGGSTPATKKAKLKSGPTYTPSGTIKAKKSGGAKTASFRMSAEFEHDPGNNIHASCGQIRQYIKWSSAADKPNHPGFSGSKYKHNVWYEDRDGSDKRYGHRSGTHSDPISGGGDEYLNSAGKRDQLNGAKYKGADRPKDGSGAKTGFWYFRLEAIDTCNGNSVLGTDTVTIDW